MGKHRVLIAEDNRAQSDLLVGFFQMMGDIECCGTAYDGEEAVRMVRRLMPDVLVLDIMMPQMDGLAVLQQLSEDPPAKTPCVVVTTALGDESVAVEAVNLGAKFYMLKPYRMSDLYERIKMFANRKKPVLARTPVYEADWDAAISRRLMGFGTPTNVLGYRYISDALRLMTMESDPCSMSQVYAVIAEHRNATPSGVESAIRKTVKRIYEHGTPASERFFAGGKRPCNARFLSKLAEEIKQEVLHAEPSH